LISWLSQSVQNGRITEQCRSSGSIRCILPEILFLYNPLKNRQSRVIIHKIVPVVSFFQMFNKCSLGMKLQTDCKCFIGSLHCFNDLNAVRPGEAGNLQTCVIHTFYSLMMPGRTSGKYIRSNHFAEE